VGGGVENEKWAEHRGPRRGDIATRRSGLHSYGIRGEATPEPPDLPSRTVGGGGTGLLEVYIPGGAWPEAMIKD